MALLGAQVDRQTALQWGEAKVQDAPGNDP
jgi:hypothetical protein